MKKIILFLLISINAWSQQITPAQWDEEAKTNIRLLPKYGTAEKTEAQKQSDAEFIAEAMKQPQFEGNRTAASHSLIGLGFNYLRKGDIKTAMYRFNQAYLLDSNNTDIYWGYGAVYMALGDPEGAKQQYEEGLAANSENTHLLTDLATYFLGKYYAEQDKKESAAYLSSGIGYLLKSYTIDPKDGNTLFKLSVFYYLTDDCKNAKKFHNECKVLDYSPITEAYTEDLLAKCGK